VEILGILSYSCSPCLQSNITVPRAQRRLLTPLSYNSRVRKCSQSNAIYRHHCLFVYRCLSIHNGKPMCLFIVNVYLGELAYEIAFQTFLFTRRTFIPGLWWYRLNYFLTLFPSTEIIATAFNYFWYRNVFPSIHQRESFFRHPILQNCRDIFIAKVYLGKVKSDTL